MDLDLAKQLLDEVFPALEALETQSAALLGLLRAKGVATDEKIAPYLEQAGNASAVRWRAIRVRTMSLLSSALQAGTEAKESPAENEAVAQQQAAPSTPESENDGSETQGKSTPQEKPDGLSRENEPQLTQAKGRRKAAPDSKDKKGAA
jgi:hypothetical protein